MKATGSNLKHYIVLSLGSVLGQFLNFFSVPLLTRMYRPEDFALWAVVISTTTLLGIGATFRLELTLPLEKDIEKSHFLFLMSTAFSVILSAISLPFLYYFLGPVFGHTFESHIINIFWVIPILIVCSAVQQTSIYWYIKNEQMYAISILNLLTVVFIASIQIGLHSYSDQYGLIYGSLVGQVLATGLSLLLLKNYKWIYLKKIKITDTVQLIKKYKVYPMLVTPYAFLSASKDRVTIIILTQFMTANVVGFFSIAQRVMNLPVTVSGYTFRPVLFFRANNLDPKISKMISQIQQFILVIFAGATAILYFYRRQLFGLVFGPGWETAGDFAFVILPSALAFSLFLWMDRLFDVYQKQKQILVFEIIVSAIYFSGLYLLIHNDFSVYISVYYMGSFLLFAYCFWDYYLLSKLSVSKIINTVRVGAILLCVIIGWLVRQAGL